MDDLTKKFIEKAKAVHGDRYDYSKSVWKGYHKKLTIICPDHGEFEQAGGIHYRCGCPKCNGGTKFTKDDFIKKANEVHNNRYDYSKVNYRGIKEKIIIICPDHGEFEQNPSNHIHLGNGCPYCSGNKKDTTLSFIEKAKEIHGDRYDYSKVDYLKSDSHVIITCPIHGDFEQVPDYHLNHGNGCRKCSAKDSSLEKKVKDFLDKNNIPYEENRRDLLSNGKEIDIYLPESKLGIECHGNYWHSELILKNFKGKKLTWLRNHMRDKFLIAETKGIYLLQFYQDEINNKFNIIKRMILNKAGLKRKSIFARKTEVVKNLDKKIVNNFLDKYHIQGSTRYKFSYGLVYENKLVAIMLFDSITSNRGVKGNDYQYELVRFASKERVVGGASKLLYNFLLDHPLTKEVISYSDNRISSGNMYKELGFTLDVARSDKPDYYYIYKSYAGQERYHKSRLRRSSQAKLFTKENGAKNPFNDSLSEVENAHNNGFFRIWNAGLRKWILKL